MLIIIFALLSLIHGSLSAITCKKYLDFSHIDNVELFEKQDHPECLKGHFEAFYAQDFSSYHHWFQVNQNMKAIGRQPQTWRDLEGIIGVFNDSKPVSKSLIYLDQLSPKRKAKLGAWLKLQKNISSKFKQEKYPKAIKYELAKAFPFLF